MAETLDRDRGSETDYLFGSPLGWDAFDVVRWHAVEELSQLFEYDIVLMRAAELGQLDVGSLVDGGATLSIASNRRWRSVHGVVAEAELLEHTSKLLLYRVVLVPHLWRALHRRRCRTFVDTSLQDIAAAILENRAPQHPGGKRGLSLLSGELKAPGDAPDLASYTEPAAHYRWALSDPERAKTAKRFVVQYNESDYQFLARLLEAEGISYFFEHAAQGVVLTMTDQPGHTPLFNHDDAFDLVSFAESGASHMQEVVRAYRPAHRLRPTVVTMRDYAWRKSLTKIEASMQAADSELEHYEYPAADEDSEQEPGMAPARFQMERFGAESAMSTGRSTVRTQQPGYRFRLRDRANLRDDADLVTVRTETFALQHLLDGSVLDGEPFGFGFAQPTAPFFDTKFESLPAQMRFRPKRRTTKPRIFGVQPARVTADEVGSDVELNSDEMGRVRVRFPWDQRTHDGTPSSKWIRVCHYWAGPAFGAQYTPRVGHEVLVAFERGDPDRPIVVGRLYNAQNQPPYMEANTTKSTIKSDSVGGDGSSADGFNEFRFDDLAGKEQVFLHAQRNLDEVVLANHSTSVGGDQSNSVGNNQTNTVQANRTHTVHGMEDCTVDGNRTHTVHSVETVTVDGDRFTLFNSNEVHQVGSNRTTGIGANDTLGINGWHSITVGSSQQIDVNADQQIKVGGSRGVKVGGEHVVEQGGNYLSSAGGSHAFTSQNCYVNQSSSIVLSAGSATISMVSGAITINNGAGSIINLVGGMVHVVTGAFMTTAGVNLLVASGANAMVSGGPTAIGAGGDINASAPTIKLNG